MNTVTDMDTRKPWYLIMKNMNTVTDTRKPWYLIELNEYTRLSVSFFFSLWLTGSVTAHEVFIVVRKSKKMYLYVARDFKIRASFVVNIPSQH